MIHVLLRYLGIKTKLLAPISAEISRITPKNGYVLDMFAGSNVVAQSLMNDYNVYTNDIQKYSYVVSKATVEISEECNYSLLSWRKVVNSLYFADNKKKLISIFGRILTYEANMFGTLTKKKELNTLIEFKNYYDNTPYPGNFNSNCEIFSGLEYYYSNEYYLNKKYDNDFYALFSLAYACPYFSMNQAVFIDSYRYAIDKMFENNEISNTEFNIYLSYLIYYLGNIVTSVGDHFAQPEKLKISEEKKFIKEVDKILAKKTLSVEACFDKIEKDFKSIEFFKNGNKAFCGDYKDLFKSENKKYMDKVNTIYIDPPYTNAHYSRFYHILETVVLYDYPGLEYFGRYRNDRFQSPFCIKSEAIKEFEYMIKLCFESRKNIVISYSDTKQCIVSKEELVEICKKKYNNVTVKEIDYLYRNFGQKPNKVKGNELLVICEA